MGSGGMEASHRSGRETRCVLVLQRKHQRLPNLAVQNWQCSGFTKNVVGHHPQNVPFGRFEYAAVPYLLVSFFWLLVLLFRLSSVWLRRSSLSIVAPLLLLDFMVLEYLLVGLHHLYEHWWKTCFSSLYTSSWGVFVLSYLFFWISGACCLLFLFLSFLLLFALHVVVAVVALACIMAGLEPEPPLWFAAVLSSSSLLCFILSLILLLARFPCSFCFASCLWPCSWCWYCCYCCCCCGCCCYHPRGHRCCFFLAAAVGCWLSVVVLLLLQLLLLQLLLLVFLMLLLLLLSSLL